MEHNKTKIEKKSRAMCECGWEGPWRSSENSALSDAVTHQDNSHEFSGGSITPPDAGEWNR